MKKDLHEVGSIAAALAVFVVLASIVSGVNFEEVPLALGDGDELTGNYVKSQPVLRTRSSGTRVIAKRWARPLIKCTDGDDGADLLVPSYTSTAGGQYLHDTCKDENVLLEATCSASYGSGKYHEYDCAAYGMTCKQGRCMQA